jgi:hypothetical protein
MLDLRRRQFITLLGGAAAWPLVAGAQQTRAMRRIGVLTPYPADDAEGHARLTAFAQALQQSGWTVGQNVRIDYRWVPAISFLHDDIAAHIEAPRRVDVHTVKAMLT